MAALELPPGLAGRTLDALRRGDVLLRLALCALAAVVMWGITWGWAPPPEFRLGQVPDRDVVARVEFQQFDETATAEAEATARSLARSVYMEDPTPLVQLRAKLQNTVDRIVGAATLEELEPELWQSFDLLRDEATPEPTPAEREQEFQKFREALTTEGALEKFREAMTKAFAPIEQQGLLEKLPEDHRGDQEKIFVHPVGKEQFPVEVAVSDVLVSSVVSALPDVLKEELKSIEVANRVFAWLRPQLAEMETLKLNAALSEAYRNEAVAAVEDQFKLYPVGTVLASAEKVIDDDTLELLTLEHDTMLEQRTARQAITRSLAVLGMFVALYTLCGFYIAFREPTLLSNLSRFFALLALVVMTVALCKITSPWRAELVPLLLFGMTLAIAYHQELALLLSASVALVVVFSIGHALPDMVILTAGVAAAILMLRNVRTRSKLLFVGIGSAAAAMLTTVGVGTVVGLPFYPVLVNDALWYGLWAVIAGSLMTCMLPLIERMFDVQTDLSLIELGDPGHPLLQELVRRAPGTYNHSITVASLAEAAAESIGARSLLVRVGAYFHDIGKMLKPGYFIENQTQGDNRHDALVPAMSTLVIIAHVKDGADLARQHHLPESIIDFIQQHHGTTLVEYFYRRASEQSEADPDGGEVDESAFRYPGPKPQTKENGVLMLADAVESASRVLVEPTPSRIESLVEELAMKRLLDGQFDECGLTLQELRTIQDSLIKSLTAVYHGRVKYPDQRTA